MADIIELSDLTELEFNGRNNSSMKSANFGGGLELLMNDKVKESSRQNTEIDLEDLNNLENELNNLVEEIPTSGFKTKSDLFSGIDTSNENKHSVKFTDSEPPSIGKSTADTTSEAKTWDGYGKFNNIPMNPDRPASSQPQMNKDELLREKFKFLRKLEALEKKGVELSKKYNMDSPLQEMQGEYETIIEEKAKNNSIKFQGNMLMACINGIEFLN